MPPITEQLLVRRAEHNDGCLRTLQEVALHGQGIERIEVLGQLCAHLRILLLQNNLISKIQGLHRLKELEQLNLAVNNIQRVQNLQRCENLRRLDLSLNFVPLAGLPSLRSLRENEQLEELSLLGNPCTRWPGYRAYVVAVLPHLQRLDSEQIRPSERIAAAQQLPALEAGLRAELLAEGVDPDAAAQVEDDGLLDAEHIPEPGHVDPATGQLRRPWCPATRVLEHREAEAEAAAAEAQRQAAQATGASELGGEAPEPPPRLRLPDIVEGEPIYQKNEGKWEFNLEESTDGRSLQLDVAFGRYLDTSAIQADVQPTSVRLLAKGRLLQLALPAEVAPDASVAQRSKTTGNLLVTMPLAAAGGAGLLRPACCTKKAAVMAGSCSRGRGALLGVPELAAAVVRVAVAGGGSSDSSGSGAGTEDDEDLPPL